MRLPADAPVGGAFAWRIYLVALALRLIPVLLARDLGIGLDDMFQYDMLARSLVKGDGYRWYAQEDLRVFEPYIEFDLTTIDYDPRGVLTSFRAPLYPAFLAFVYFFSGIGTERFFAARLAQAFLSAALAPLTCMIARRVSPVDQRVAGSAEPPGRAAGSSLSRPCRDPVETRWSAWTVAIYPMLLIYPLALATENLFFVLLLASVLTLLWAAEDVRSWKFALAGVLLGSTALTRSVILPFGLLTVLWAWFALKQPRAAFTLLAAMLLTLLPWVVRNSLLHQRPTGIETSLGYNLYVGYHPQGNGSFQFGPSLDLIPMLDDAERDRIGAQKALEFIRQDPLRAVLLAPRRLGHFFGLERRALTYFYSNNFFGYISLPLLLTAAALLLLPFVFVSLSAAFGLALIHWDRRTTLLAILFLGYLLPHVLILSEDRFHLAMIPFLAIPAARFWAGGLPALRARWGESRAGRTAILLAAVAAALLLFNWGLELYLDAEKLALLLGPTGNQTYFPY